MRLRLPPRFQAWLRRRSTKGLVGLSIAAVATLLLVGGGAYALLGGFAQTTSTNDINLQSGLVGWWKMNGNAKDSTPNGDNGTVNGATLTADRKGVANSAYSFNGTSSYIGVSASTLLNVSASFTLSSWFNLSSYNSGDTIISKRAGSNEQWAVRVYGSNNVKVEWNDGSVWRSNTATIGTIVSLNTYHHIAVTYNGSTLYYYIDGVQYTGTGDTPSFQSYSSSPLCFGQDCVNTSGRYLSGALDDIRVYNRAISAAEALALYKEYDAQVNAASGESGLLSWWKMDGNNKDATPYGDNLTLNGTSYTTDRKGTSNSAMNFNGTSDYAYGQIGGGTWFGGNNPLTAMGWVYASATSSGPIFGMANNGPNPTWDMPFLSINGTTVYGWIYNLSILSTTVTANKWHHLAITYTPGGSPSVILYVDGVQAGTTTGSYTSSGAPMFFTTYIPGAKPGGVTSYLNTPISDIRAYNRVLSASQIATIANSYNSQINLNSSPTNQSTVNLNSGLIGYWPFNGNTKDATPYSRNGTAVGSPTLTTDRNGRANSAYLLNGSTQYISLPSSVVPNGAYTKTAWIKMTATTGNNNIFSGNGGCGGSPLWAPSGKLNSGHCSNFNYVSDPTTLTVGTWYFVVVTFDPSVGSGTMKLYKNANLISTATSVPNASDTATQIGGFGGGNTLNGTIDDVRIYNRALTPTEITALYGNYY